MSSNYMSHLGSGVTPKPMGSAFPTVVPYRVFHASDRVFSIAVGSEKLWTAFCEAIGHLELRAHPDYASNASRIQNRHELERKLEEIFRARTAAEWIRVLGSAGVPSSLVLNFAEVVKHPQSAFREMFPWMEHPTAGAHRVTGSPIKMSETPGRPSTGAPLLGQDTPAVLQELLSLNNETVGELMAGGVILPIPRAGCNEISQPDRPAGKDQ
jgi:crotonobetainyl-CoA:carnitine CoA-transferase CaiB-like acyl-CoA transferase